MIEFSSILKNYSKCFGFWTWFYCSLTKIITSEMLRKKAEIKFFALKEIAVLWRARQDSIAMNNKQLYEAVSYLYSSKKTNNFFPIN